MWAPVSAILSAIPPTLFLTFYILYFLSYLLYFAQIFRNISKEIFAIICKGLDLCPKCPHYIFFNLQKAFLVWGPFKDNRHPIQFPYFTIFYFFIFHIVNLSTLWMWAFIFNPSDMISHFLPIWFLYVRNFISLSTFRKYLWCELLAQCHSLPNYSDIISYVPLNVCWLRKIGNSWRYTRQCKIIPPSDEPLGEKITFPKTFKLIGQSYLKILLEFCDKEFAIFYINIV